MTHIQLKQEARREDVKRIKTILLIVLAAMAIMFSMQLQKTAKVL